MSAAGHRAAGRTLAWIERYLDRYPHLVLVPCHGKVPCRFDTDGRNWNADPQLIRTADQAAAWWAEHPSHNVGVHLASSGLVSLDLDHPAARDVLAAEGIDVDDLMRRYPTIRGRGMRIEFRYPLGFALRWLKIRWPQQDNPQRDFTLLELRASAANLQDILPPSWHPDAGREYRWETPPGEAFPDVSDELLKLWTDPQFERRARSRCPWAQPMPQPERRPSAAPRTYTGPSVSQAFCDAHDPGAILEAHGYRPAGTGRWLAPGSTHGAGVSLLRDGRHIISHHGDVLGDGKPHDAFDVFRILAHAGDWRAATKAAAKALGMDYASRKREVAA